MWTSVWILYFVLKFATTLKDHITVLVFLDIVWWLIESTAKQQVNINSELLIFTSCTILSLVHTCETSTSNWKLCLYTWSKHKKMKHLRAQSGLCVVFFAYACFTNVHTGETNKISTSTRERENVLCLCLFHKCEPCFRVNASRFLNEEVGKWNSKVFRLFPTLFFGFAQYLCSSMNYFSNFMTR